VGAALGAPDLAGTEGLAQLGPRLRAADTLFVLDNCEHLIAAAAETAAALLQAAPGVRVLATSREALGIPGEMELPVPPLARPSALDPATIRGSEAVQLFLERARANRPDLKDDDDTLATAAQICAELDGIPLALELAAARAKALSLPEIAGRLEDRFKFLTAWQRLTPARHRTLREAIDWSYDLLAPREQQTFDRLGVFAGGFNLDAVAAVCLDDVEQDALEIVERLVRSSLVEVVGAAGGTRYRLLETIRQYALERLAAAGTEPIMHRHAEYFCRFAEGANLSAEARKFDDSFSRIRTELPNIRVALRWGIDHDVVVGLRLACALEQFWVVHSPREGAAIFTELLEKPGLPLALRARATRCLSGCRYYVGDFEAGSALLEESLAMSRELGDRPAIGHALMRKAIEAHRRGDVVATRALLDESRRLSGSDRYSGDETSSLMIEARLAIEAGRAEDGIALFRESRESARREGDRWFEAQALLNMTESALRIGRASEAAESGRTGLVVANDLGDRQLIVYALSLLAWAAAASRDPGRAGRLWGAIEGEVARRGPVGQWEDERADYEPHVLVGPEGELAKALTLGRAMSLEDAIVEAVTPPPA